MKEKYDLLKYILYFILLIIITKSDDNIDANDNNSNYNNSIIIDAERQGFNIQNPEDIFFNDICKYYKSENGKDVTLEYRRKYYYYPNGDQLIILNYNELNKIFPVPKRNNIFLCFYYFLNIGSLFYLNISFFILFPILVFQITGLLIFLCGKYKIASEKTPELYNEYIKRKNKKKLFNNLNNIVYNINSLNNINTTNNINENNNSNTFNTLHEENENNSDFINNSHDVKTKEDIIKNENNNNIFTHQAFISQTIEKTSEEDKKNEELNLTEDFQPNLQDKEIKNIDDDKKIQNQKRILNPDEIYTFGGMKLDLNDKDKEEDSGKNSIIISDLNKAEKTEYIYYKMNDKKNYKINYNIKNPQSQQTDNLLTKEELFYCGFSVAILQDKRSFNEIYYDYLSHNQIIFYFLPNYYIFEDPGLTIIYYTFKIILYYIFILISFNSSYIINKIYDNNFSLFDYFIRCILTNILVNIISQFLFLLTNSKRIYIRYKVKICSSLFGKKRILKYVLKDAIDLISYNLYWKLLILFLFSIFLFLITCFLCICFCSCYYNTQFLILKCVIFCIIISQTLPFILAIIPAKLRYKSIKSKSNKLYLISKMFDSYFLP